MQPLILSFKKPLALVFLALLATACAPFQPSSYPGPQQPPTTTPPSPPQYPTQPPQYPTQPPPQEITPVKAGSTTGSEAVTGLIEQAWQLHNNGEYDRSNAMAERAQRLSASTAEVYLVLASNYFALAELGLAKQLARQGLPFTQNNWVIERRLKSLLQRIAQAGG